MEKYRKEIPVWRPLFSVVKLLCHLPSLKALIGSFFTNALDCHRFCHQFEPKVPEWIHKITIYSKKMFVELHIIWHTDN